MELDPKSLNGPNRTQNKITFAAIAFNTASKVACEKACHRLCLPLLYFIPVFKREKWLQITICSIRNTIFP